MMMKIMLDEEMISRKKFCYIFKPQLIELIAEGRNFFEGNCKKDH